MLLARLLVRTADGRPGDEVNGGAYAPQPVRLARVDDTWATNPRPLLYPGMPATVLGGVELTDGLRPVLRLPTSWPEPVTAGAAVLIDAGAIRVRLADLPAAYAEALDMADPE